MKLALVKQDHMGDWYTIEKAYHSHTEWYERTEYGLSFQHSGRISDACVEGTAYEMRELAVAIERRGAESFKRCAVDATKEKVEFWSPRNSQRRGIVSRVDADALAAEIFRIVGRTQ